MLWLFFRIPPDPRKCAELWLTHVNKAFSRGFEPLISSVTSWRALQAAPREQACAHLNSTVPKKTRDLPFRFAFALRSDAK